MTGEDWVGVIFAAGFALFIVCFGIAIVISEWRDR